MVLTLVSDMILLNKYGFMSTAPELLLEEIAGELGVDHRKLEIEKKFLTFNRVSGFLSVWKMPKIQQTALKAGSVLVTRNNSGSDLPLENIIDHRFGINTEQGYGQVKINLHGKSGSEITVESYQDKTPVSLQKGELLPLGDFIRAILIKRLKILLKAEAVEQARETGKIPSSAFLGKMLTFIEQSRSLQELYELVNRLKERGRKQLALLEKGLIIKSGKIDKKRIETFITPVYNHMLENPDSKNILLQSADIEEHFFKEEKYLFDLYQTYAGFFLNQLKLKKRRENE